MAHTETQHPATPAGGPLSALPRLRVVYSPGEGVATKGQRHSLPVGTSYLGRELPADKDGITLAADRSLSAVQTVAAQLRVDGISEALLTRLRQRPRQGQGQGQSQSQCIAREPVQAIPTVAARPHRLQQPEKEAMLELAQRLKGNVSHIATELGCSRRQAKRWLDLYGVKTPDL